jgi:hypothetical protein
MLYAKICPKGRALCLLTLGHISAYSMDNTILLHKYEKRDAFHIEIVQLYFTAHDSVFQVVKCVYKSLIEVIILNCLIVIYFPVEFPSIT